MDPENHEESNDEIKAPPPSISEVNKARLEDALQKVIACMGRDAVNKELEYYRKLITKVATHAPGELALDLYVFSVSRHIKGHESLERFTNDFCDIALRWNTANNDNAIFDLCMHAVNGGTDCTKPIAEAIKFPPLLISKEHKQLITTTMRLVQYKELASLPRLDRICRNASTIQNEQHRELYLQSLHAVAQNGWEFSQAELIIDRLVKENKFDELTTCNAYFLQNPESYTQPLPLYVQIMRQGMLGVYDAIEHAVREHCEKTEEPFSTIMLEFGRILADRTIVDNLQAAGNEGLSILDLVKNQIEVGSLQGYFETLHSMAKLQGLSKTIESMQILGRAGIDQRLHDMLNFHFHFEDAPQALPETSHVLLRQFAKIYLQMKIPAVQREELGYMFAFFDTVSEDPNHIAIRMAQTFIQALRWQTPEFRLKGWLADVQEGKFGKSTSAEALDALNSIFTQTLVRQMMGGENATKAQSAYRYFAISDDQPFPAMTHQGVNPKAQEAFRQTLKVLYRVYDIYDGFGGLTYEARRIGPSDLPLIARFGEDCGAVVNSLNVKRNDIFPGKGVIIKNFTMKKVFAPDRIAEAIGSDPYGQLKATWPWLTKDIDWFSKTQYYFCRGFIAISCPEDPSLVINGVHCSLIIFNQHFHNPHQRKAFLVSTDKLLAVLQKSESDIMHGFDFNSAHENANDTLDSTEAIKMLVSTQLPVVDIGSNSVPGGGLCSALPPKSSPYFNWENKVNGTLDIAGHTHKFYLTNYVSHGGRMDYRPHADAVGNSRVNLVLGQLQELHLQISDISNALLNRLDIFRIAFSMYKKGFTNHSDDDSFDTDQQELELSDDNTSPVSTRMLERAYAIHREGHAAGWPKKIFPILTIAKTLQYPGTISGQFALDTYSLEAKSQTQTVQLPLDSDGSGEFEKQLWESWVSPHVMQTAEDLRFLDRGYLS